MNKKEFARVLAIGMSLNSSGAGGDDQRLAVIDDIISIGQAIDSNATWVKIHAKIRSFYVPGFVIKIKDTIALGEVTDTILCMLDDQINIDVADNISSLASKINETIGVVKV